MATLNENIANIEEGSLLETLYNKLLAGFVEGQQETLPDFTSGEYVTVTHDEETGIDSYVVDEAKVQTYLNTYKDIAMRNSAYMLADAIVGSFVGDGSGSGGGGAFVRISGDNMTGKLTALYKFEAGDNGVTILDVYQRIDTDGEGHDTATGVVRIDGELHLSADGIFINDRNILRYDDDTVILGGDAVTVEGDLNVGGVITLGDLTISEDGINFNGLEFYHSGNSNKADVDWTMHDANVYGDLTVHGDVNYGGFLSALHGFELGADGDKLFYSTSTPILDDDDEVVGYVHDIRLSTDLVIGRSYGLKIGDDYIVHVKNDNVISFSASNRILNLGDDGTTAIALQTGIWDMNQEYELVSETGDGYFPNSFRASYHRSGVLIETYQNSDVDKGVMVKKLRFDNTADGPAFYGDRHKVYLEGRYYYMSDDAEPVEMYEEHTTSVEYVDSVSLYAPLNRKSSTLSFETDADFYMFDKPLEAKISLGIANSKTRLLPNQLFFDDSVYWLAIADGVKHYGNAYMTGSIGTETFSSGFAGSGWKIYQDELTGNQCATFDELTVRKKMRIYELEVQKQSVTNGSLWVSDACSGDLVEEVF